MINLADSLVESYMYADMFNREYEGGDSGTEKIYGAGLPVEYIVPTLNNKDQDDPENQGQEGGAKCKGPLTNKVVPVGLVFIRVQRDPDLEYDDHFYTGVNREVVPDSLYETLMKSVIKSTDRYRKKRQTTRKLKKSTDQSRKNK